MWLSIISIGTVPGTVPGTRVNSQGIITGRVQIVHGKYCNMDNKWQYHWPHWWTDPLVSVPCPRVSISIAIKCHPGFIKPHKAVSIVNYYSYRLVSIHGNPHKLWTGSTVVPVSTRYKAVPLQVTRRPRVFNFRNADLRIWFCRKYRCRVRAICSRKHSWPRFHW